MANKVYAARETVITFGSNSNTVTFTPKNVATANGRVSAEWDRGASSAPGRYLVKCFSKSGSTYTVDLTIRPYYVQHDGSLRPGVLGGTDAALSSEAALLRCWVPLPPIIAHVTTSSTVIASKPQIITLVDRYVQFAWWNALGVTLTNTDADHIIQVLPCPPEVQ
jgi:hypothetical protein